MCAGVYWIFNRNMMWRLFIGGVKKALYVSSWLKVDWRFSFILKSVYWKVITIQIEYTKRCLLKSLNSSYLIHIKGAYRPKKCLLNKNVSIDQKCAYRMKICLLRGYNLLCINSGSYLFSNLFSISSLSYLLETQKICGSSPKLLFVS